MKRKPLVIPIFIPHEGCPHRCVYCDQATISGVSQFSWSPGLVREHVQSYLGNSNRYPVQVAFYGGTFTLLSEARQRVFLESVQELLEQGRVHSLRLSTRPDAIEANNLNFLHSMGVKTIELGAQSLSDKVLAATARGHSARQAYKASLELQKLGFEVGLQLMPGLPGDCWETFSNTVEKSIALQPNFVRLYPTVVLANTPLERLYLRGLFKPLSLDEAVEWCKKAKQSFNHASIPVIRTGLQPTISLEQPGRIVSGPYHPAFGQLVQSAIWNERISSALEKARCRSSRLLIHAPSHHLPDIRGHHNENIHRWLKELDLISLKTVVCSRTREGMFRVTAQ